MHLLTSTKKSFSAKELQRQLGHKRYHLIWHMLHKLRNLKDFVDRHNAQVIPKDKVGGILPWVHIAISFENSHSKFLAIKS
jgi:hypothetical protein